MKIFKYIFGDKEVSLLDFVVFLWFFYLAYELIVAPITKGAGRIFWKFLLSILEKIF